ncbi:hypothetical protein C7974DRAFT_131125 [Boeremia exigua]|uniref:uncharacterized protein n=1 Tax=Boeremia exigua TaxID=749465 RepID=UPI001E8E6ACB|nr:uncharacterized protein C7974DRAFT_131125 [Boeremia exigua]KAH6639429.1 hypothetical protein C7974DRAFT_131125 [Boeremia exigua]
MNNRGGRRSGTSTSPHRMRGRDLEARGLATRLFPPDPSPEICHAGEYERCSEGPSEPLRIPREPLHRQLPTLSLPQAHGRQSQIPLQARQPRYPAARDIPPQITDAESLPSPLDGSPLHSMCHSPHESTTRTVAPAARIVRPPGCHQRHCRHAHSDASRSHSPSSPLAASNETHKAVDRDLPKSVPSEDTESIKKKAHTETLGAPRKAFTFSIPWHALLVTMGLILFIFAFAILVAHCLAWFLVYKTEARLGDVRSGLLRGGEMKLCLCGKG